MDFEKALNHSLESHLKIHVEDDISNRLICHVNAFNAEHGAQVSFEEFKRHWPFAPFLEDRFCKMCLERCIHRLARAK